MLDINTIQRKNGHTATIVNKTVKSEIYNVKKGKCSWTLL